jgi:hypothetical protein
MMLVDPSVRILARLHVLGSLFLGLVVWVPCQAQTAEVARVVDAAGRWATNGDLATVTTVGQPGPAGCSTNPAHINWSGFLNAFLMFPALDNDHDGIVDENDPDDDNDGLPDALELGGSAFDPTTVTDPLRADSDGDGMSDSQEAAVGTNPGDTNSLLRITGFRQHGAGVIVTWRSREGRTYDLLEAETVAGLVSNAVTVTNVTAVNGTGIWHEAESAGTDAADRSNAVYRVRVISP